MQSAQMLAGCYSMNPRYGHRIQAILLRRQGARFSKVSKRDSAKVDSVFYLYQIDAEVVTLPYW